jgi:DGQHR domain-containing protein
MDDSEIELAFQCYLGLSPVEEMAIFNVINGKAKGLSSSLLDYHKTKLIPGLETVQLDLYIAKTLHDDPDSVWHGRLKFAGATPGTKRRVSLRSLQSATKLMLQRSLLDSATELEPFRKYEIVRAFWCAASRTWPSAWENPRGHLLTKGVGVTALSMLAGDIVTAALTRGQTLNEDTFAMALAPLKSLDWSTTGPFKAYGGRQGASEAHRVLVQRAFGPALACA